MHHITPDYFILTLPFASLRDIYIYKVRGSEGAPTSVDLELLLLVVVPQLDFVVQRSRQHVAAVWGEAHMGNRRVRIHHDSPQALACSVQSIGLPNNSIFCHIPHITQCVHTLE